jgi:hypothetical protein
MQAAPVTATPQAMSTQSGKKNGIKLFGKFNVPGSFVAYGVLAGLSAASLMALYGVMLTFVLKTVPATDEEEKSVDPTGIMKKLKESMIGLIVGIITPIFIIAIIVGSGTKGLLRAEIMLFLFTSMMALTLMSTALAYTQDRRVEATPKLKRGVEVAMIGSSVLTVVLGLAGVIEFMKKRKQVGADAGAAFKELKSGNLKGAGSFFLSGKTEKQLTQNAKTVMGDSKIAQSKKQSQKTMQATKMTKHAAHEAAKQAKAGVKAGGKSNTGTGVQ